MKCPNCGGSNVCVKDSRKYGANTIRRRSCSDCGNTFYTKEIVIEFNDGYEIISEYYRNYSYWKSHEKKEVVR